MLGSSRNARWDTFYGGYPGSGLGTAMSRAADKAYNWIRQRILAREYAAGAHLREEHIAEETGVSRTPVREALRRLSSEHLVQFVANRGAYVATWSTQDVDDIFKLRYMLEGYAANRAASRISPEQIERLEHYASELEALSRRPNSESKFANMAEHNQSFHKTIIEAAASERLKVLLSWLVEVPMLLRTYERFDDSAIERSNRHHREIITALKAKDADWAQKVMETHLHAAHRVFLSQAGESPAQAPSGSPRDPKFAAASG